MDIDIHSLRNPTDAEGQINQCEAALLKNPQALIFAAVDGVSLAACLRKASEKGILLVDIDGNIDQSRTKDMGITVSFSVASDNYDLGKMAADYIKGQKGKVLVIEGTSASQPGRLRVKGFSENLGEGLQIVASQPGDWDRLKSANIAIDVITRHPDLSFIFAANDTMALGAANISTVKVIGVDGSTDAVRSIREGRLTASVAQLPYLMAKEALEKTAQALHGDKPETFNQYVPIIMLDASVLKKNNDPLLRYLR